MLTGAPSILAGSGKPAAAIPRPPVILDLQTHDATASSLDDGWMQPGFTVEYKGHPLNGGDSGSPLDWFQSHYAITARDDGLETVSFTVQGSTLDTVTTGQAITYNATTREEMPRNGRYTPLWINDSNVATGQAYIGDQYAVMTPLSNSAFYQFATPTQTFYYARETGFLVAVEDDESFRFAVQTDRSE